MPDNLNYTFSTNIYSTLNKVLVKEKFPDKHNLWISVMLLRVMLDILSGRHLVAVFESPVESAQAFKAHRQGDIQHGHIAFDQQKRSLAAADIGQIFDHGTTEMIVEQAGKTALAVTEMTGQMLHADGLLVIVLQINQHILHQVAALVAGVITQPDAGNQKTQHHIGNTLLGFGAVFIPVFAGNSQHGGNFFVFCNLKYDFFFINTIV